MYCKILSAIISVTLFAFTSSAEIFPVQNNKGKYGYADENGELVIKYGYNEAHPFVDGMAKVRKGNKWGYIDTQGKEVIKINYTEMGMWIGEYCRVAKGGKFEDGILTKAKYGFINRAGEEVIKPEYDEIGQFYQSVAYIKKGDKYGYINSDMQIILPCEFDGIGLPNMRGLIWVNKGGKYKDASPTPGKRYNYGGKYGIYNDKGEILIPCQYKSIGMFITDSIVTENNMALCGGNPYAEDFINKLIEKYMEDTQLMGNDYRQHLYSMICAYEMLHCQNASLYTRDIFDTPILGCDKRQSGVSRTTEWCAANTELDLLSKLPDLGSNDNESWAYLWYSENYDGSYPGIYNWAMKENVIDPGTYEMIGDIREFRPFIADNVGKSMMSMNYYNIIDHTKMFDSDITFDARIDIEGQPFMLSAFSDGVAEVREYGSSKLINIVNVRPLPQTYDRIYDLFGDYVIVGDNDKYGMFKLDELKVSSTEIAPMIYDKLMQPSDSMILAVKDGKYGFLSMNGTEKIPFKYDKAYKFAYGASSVCLDGNFGLIDHNGHPIVPLKWRNALSLDRENARYAWVAIADSTFYAYDIASQKLMGGGYYQVLTYFDDDNVAYVSMPTDFYVSDDSGNIVKESHLAIGCVTPTGEIIIPYSFLDINDAKQAYATMKEEGKTRLTETDGMRFIIYSTNLRNQFNINDIVPDELWDY